MECGTARAMRTMGISRGKGSVYKGEGPGQPGMRMGQDREKWGDLRKSSPSEVEAGCVGENSSASN